MNKKIFYNPFYFIAGYKALLFGIVGFIITCILAYKTGTHFNGLLNIDFAKDSDLWVYFLENFSFWIISSICFYFAGIILSKSKIRLIDILGTTLLSRLPLIITPLFRIIPIFQSFGFYSFQLFFLVFIYIASLIWTIILLYNSYKVSCNLKNIQLNISFIICLLLSEVLTKVLIHIII